MWTSAATPDLANSDYLHKYYSQVFRSPGWISNAVGSHLGVTGSLGYDIYEKENDGSLTVIGSTTSSSYSFKTKGRGQKTFVVKTAYTSLKSNASSGISNNVTSTGGSETDNVTISVKNNSFTKDQTISINSFGEIKVYLNGKDITKESEVTLKPNQSVTEGSRNIYFNIKYDGDNYTASTLATFK